MRKLRNNELTRLSIEEFKMKEKTPLVIVLDNIRSMNNTGSVFRTGDAYKIEHVYLCGITATPPHKDIHKTALGATESVEWTYAENSLDLIMHLKEQGYETLAVEQAEGSVSLDKFKIDKNKKYAIVMGNEVKGVQQKVVDVCDGVIELPQFGTKHSLNVSVCTGIVIWEFYKGLMN